MVIANQINPNTIKVPYSIATKRQIMWHPICGFCGGDKTPVLISVTISDIVATCVTNGGSYIVNATFFNDTWELAYKYFGACTWGYEEVGSFGTVDHYNVPDCEGEVATPCDITIIRVWVEVRADGRVTGRLGYTADCGCSGYFWATDWTVPEVGYCTKITDIPHLPPASCGVGGGTMTIVEIR